MIGLSTSFLPRDPELASARRERLIAFDVAGYELDSRITVDEIRTLVDEVRVRHRTIESLRMYCPRGREVPRGLEDDVPILSSLDAEERRQGVHGLELTMEWAARLEARAVIVRCGKVTVPLGVERLEELATRGALGGADGRRALETVAGKRKEAGPRFLAALCSSLDRILRMAERLEVAVAIENPREPAGIPTLDELEVLLAEFRGSPLATWLHVEHAHHLGILGGLPIAAWRQAMAPTLLGYHLTDARGLGGGLPPGEGEIDFRAAIGDVAPSVPFVVECPEGTHDTSIAAGIQVLRDLGLEGPPPAPWEDHLPIIGGPA